MKRAIRLLLICAALWVAGYLYTVNRYPEGKYYNCLGWAVNGLAHWPTILEWGGSCPR